MCGIIYAKNLKDNHPVNNLVKILYENQKDRGQQGFGFVGMNKEHIDTYRATEQKGILKFLNNHYYDEIIFHHRLPTSTQNTLKSTHPFVIEVEDKKYYFVHNGIIQNAEKLKEKHAKRGIAYSSEKGDTFNDSEALAWEFCLWLNNKQKKIEAKGSVAFICLETNRETNRAQKLYFYCNGEVPLKIYQDKNLFLLASEGNYTELRQNWLYFWDYHKRQISRYKPLEIQSQQVFSFNQYDYSYLGNETGKTEFDLSEMKENIRFWEQERDYLLSIGQHNDAEQLDWEIESLKDQCKQVKALGNTSPLW